MECAVGNNNNLLVLCAVLRFVSTVQCRNLNVLFDGSIIFWLDNYANQVNVHFPIDQVCNTTTKGDWRARG